MKLRSDIVKVYKDVHIWVGIVAGLLLFIAFYAGAITMFEKPLERWATPPSRLAAPPPLARASELVDAVLAAHPEAAKNYAVVIETTPDLPARVVWRERGERRGQVKAFGAAFAADGSLQVERLSAAPVAQFVDTLHQKVGLPLPDSVARILMGIVALLYGVALVSGVIILLPTLAKDFFALRIGRNIKRLWLDVHNALGIVSLPFHLIMALTCVVFAFHDPFYDVQGKLVYPHGIQWGQEAEPAPPPPGTQPLSPTALLQKVRQQLPGFRVHELGFQNDHGRLESSVTGLDVRYGTRARTYMRTHVDPYTGVVDPHDLPGHMDSWDTSVNTFFMLHFGSFGGNPVRWMYLLLGLAGALIFYTGNLLWIESRRKKQREAGLPEQKRSTRVLGSLTVGVALGCVAGISATIAASKWLPAFAVNAAAWHEGIYYAVFLLCIAWALLRGAARSASELLWLAAFTTALIPLSSLLSALGVGGWNHPGVAIAVDATALVAVPLMLLVAAYSRRRLRDGHADSIWSGRAAAVPTVEPQTR